LEEGSGFSLGGEGGRGFRFGGGAGRCCREGLGGDGETLSLLFAEAFVSRGNLVRLAGGSLAVDAVVVVRFRFLGGGVTMTSGSDSSSSSYNSGSPELSDWGLGGSMRRKEGCKGTGREVSAVTRGGESSCTSVSGTYSYSPAELGEDEEWATS
jgi:hypothetical protein